MICSNFIAIGVRIAEKSLMNNISGKRRRLDTLQIDMSFIRLVAIFDGNENRKGIR